jgi:SAM-dependent methyltransferase
MSELRQVVPMPAKRAADYLVWLATRRSIEFWNLHYRAHGTSGPGSRGDAARFKASEMNRIVATNAIQTVVEFGCGDGYQLGLLSIPRYVGLDVSPRAVQLCIEQFRHDNTKSFLRYDPYSWQDNLRVIHADMSLSMDVILHLVEDEIFHKYMMDLFGAADHLVAIYSSNVAASEAQFTQHRHFTDWVSTHQPGWRMTEHVPNPDGSGTDFYLYRRVDEPAAEKTMPVLSEPGLRSEPALPGRGAVWPR